MSVLWLIVSRIFLFKVFLGRLYEGLNDYDIIVSNTADVLLFGD